MTTIGILGCGPMGLLVAHAAELAGHDVKIYSVKQKSDIPGSMHLHGPVPGLTGRYPEGTIQFIRMGTPEVYARKVYGDDKRLTGWDNYYQVYPSWNVLKAYDKLWDWYEDQITDVEVTHGLLGQLDYEFRSGALVSTIPQHVLCVDPRHKFNGVPYFIKRVPTPPDDQNHELVVYNGLAHDPWYRWSILGGLCSIEYSLNPPPDFDEKDPAWAYGQKAIDNTCTCWPFITRLGRWAEWKHGVTLFSSFTRAQNIMEAL